MQTWTGKRQEEACHAQDMPAQHVSHTLEEAKSLFDDDAIADSEATGGHDAPRSLLHKRKGVVGEPENGSAVQVFHHPNNLRMGDSEEFDSVRFKDRDVAWILAREDSRKRTMKPGSASLDFSSLEVEMVSAKDIQTLLVEGARLCAFGQQKSSAMLGDGRLEAGCSVHDARKRCDDHPVSSQAATDGEMDIPLTPEIVHNHRERLASADHTSSSSEPSSEQGVSPSPGKETQQGELLETCLLIAEHTASEQPMPRTKDGAHVQHSPEEIVGQEGQVPNAKEKTKRKRKYMPKVRSEKPKASRAKKPRNTAVNAIVRPEIPEVMTSPSVLQMKSFARINQRYPKQHRRTSKLADAPVSKPFPAAENLPGCEDRGPPVVHGDDLSRFLKASLTADRSLQLGENSPLPGQNLSGADQAGSSSFGSLVTYFCNLEGQPPESNQGSSITRLVRVQVEGDLRTPYPNSTRLLTEEIHVHHSAVEDLPSTPQRSPTVDPFRPTHPDFTHENMKDLPSTPQASPAVHPFVQLCRDFTLVMPPSSPPSPRAVVSDVADLWDQFELESRPAAPTSSVRRTLDFDSPVEPWLHKCHMNQLNQANINMPVIEQAAEDPSESSREKELQMVAYDEGSKKMVVYKRPPRVRRMKYKPKVNLDSSTVRMFNMLTIKATAEDEAAAEQEKDSWEQARLQWRDRAHHFISTMREVQGNRAFSRWKGSVMDSVGGAFLTQNVSDFLSSNAFISLRARFPAGKTQPKKTESMSTSPDEQQPAEPVERESLGATIPRPESPTILELEQQQFEDNRRAEEFSERVAALLGSDSEFNDNTSSAEQSLTDIVEILRIEFSQCHIEPKDTSNQDLPRPGTMLTAFWRKEEEIPSKERKESSEDVEAPAIMLTSGMSITEAAECTMQSNVDSMEVDQPTEASSLEKQLHHDLMKRIIPNPVTEIVAEEEVLPINPSERNLNSESVENDREIQATDKFMQVESVLTVDCASELLPGAGELQPVEEADGQDKQDPHVQTPIACASPSWEGNWTGNVASTVILEKFASVVTEKMTSLAQVGRENVLAATLRQVLGKKQTTREVGFGDRRPKALRYVKLRPARAALRKSTENYRYRQNVSFKLLTGEARANWEAGFVMKSQKAKWEPLRAAILADENYCRDPLTQDSVDWVAVQNASVHEVADVIKNRGQHNALAGRLKAFLDRVHRDQDGTIDLEWIRKLPPEDAKAFLMSFRGMGLKSVECIRLLTLHHPSFPVDTNVGRILVRLGWVPLEPLPEETQLHLLELYPIQSQIQQYIWPRMCTLDQRTLYELHYQMITFGKVFCTKSKPNCNACPLRSECKHFASSYASAKLLLKDSEKEDNQSKMLLEGCTIADPSVQTAVAECSRVIPGPCIPIIEEPCVPIIEEPQSPEPDPESIPDIEEVPFQVEVVARPDPVETIIGNSSSRFSAIIGELCSMLEEEKAILDLNCEPAPDSVVLPQAESEMLQPQARELNMNEVPFMGNSSERTQVIIEDGVEEPASQGLTEEFLNHLHSQELILLPPQASLAPAPKLKNVQRLRTVHFVYELPDNHPLLFEMDKREADDPCFYLLAIWSPDEVPATMPKINDDDVSNPFASCQDNAPEQTVRGTLLIPCKTAMRGYFPLNGTYFQVNEVFADHASSVQPIDVPRTLLWSLRRRFVYFSTAVSNLFKDMSQDEIRCCFQRGYVCLRAFDVATRQPKVLAPRLHQSGAKIVKARAPRKGRGDRVGKTPAEDKPRAKTTMESSSATPLMEQLQLLP